MSETNYNMVKVRDDSNPIKFSKTPNGMFELNEDTQATWCSEGSFSISDLRGRIEPWLTSLFQSEHLSLLVGSGLTSAIQAEACGQIDNCMCDFTPKSRYSEQIIKQARVSAKLMGRGDNPNFEDFIRVMCELQRGLAIQEDNEAKNELEEEIDDALGDFTNNISLIEGKIASADEVKRTEAFNKLVLFLMSFASRTGTRDRLNVFTTNYDRIIEAGADIAGIHLIDRFIGALSPIFRATRLDIDMHYNPPGIRGEPRYLEGVVHFTKLHGSIDWISTGNLIRKIGLPFGAKDIYPYLNAPGLNVTPSKIMIYPNASKDRETAEYPYVDLFRDFAASLCQPNSTLVTYGYSFGDEHINRVIKDMLTIPSTHLVIMSFDDSTGRIQKIYYDWGRKNQISLIVGSDIANITDLVNVYLPKPAIDKTSIRMAELLRQRYTQPKKEEETKEE